MDSFQISLHKLKHQLSKRSVQLLLLILLLATFLRFLHLSSLPVSLYWDEVSQGYNSYSILHTGKDEKGISFPLFFESFDDDKMPIPIYGATIPIFIFGLNEFSIRFLPALSGVLTVLFTYLFIRELFLRAGKQKKSVDVIALSTAFLLAISPWHIQLSRAAFEATIALFFIVSGFYFFLIAMRRPYFFFLSMLLLGCSFLTYRSSLLFIPSVLIGLIVIFRKELHPKHTLYVLISSIILLACFLPLFLRVAGGKDIRADQVSIFSQENPRVLQSIKKQTASGNTLLSKVIYNRRIVYSEVFLQNYFSHFSPQFLFFSGDGNARHSLTGMGLLYLFEIPFILIGFVILWVKERRVSAVLLIWLLAAPLAASISTPTPHALRALVMLPIPQVYAAFGAFSLYQVLPRRHGKVFLAGISVIIILSFFQFAQRYVFHNGTVASAAWADGYKQLVQMVEKREGRYQKVIITGHYWQPYIFFLFYKKYEPNLFQESGSKIGFGKYIFGGTGWDRRVNREELGDSDLLKLSGTKNTLVALSPEEYKRQQGHIRELTSISDHAGQTVFIIGELQ